MVNDDPYFSKSYPVPFKHKEAVDREVNRMLEYGIIERSFSPYINPIVPVVKKDGSVRLCLDARELNRRLQDDHDGPEDMEQVFKKCAKGGVISSFDLTTSFWQVPLHEESRKYTTFLHRGKTYHYTVIPFGTKVSTAALARASENILRGLEDTVVDFVDDWVVLSVDDITHLKDLRELFDRISREGVTIKFAKVKLYRKMIKFLGCMLTSEGLMICRDKVQDIWNFSVPRSKTQLKSFLGLVNFCSKFSDKFAYEAAPLYELLKGTTYHWTPSHEEAFRKVKETFVEGAFLHHPVRDLPYVLVTDASERGLGACLMQIDREGNDRVVCLASRT